MIKVVNFEINIISYKLINCFYAFDVKINIY